jgi:hypothetical protein
MEEHGDAIALATLNSRGLSRMLSSPFRKETVKLVPAA